MNRIASLKNRNLMNWLGLLGVAGFISFLLAVLISPSAYPGYDWLKQAVSDLSAKDAPSRELWSSISCLSGAGGLVCTTLACLYVKNRLNKISRLGVYLYAVMNWISNIGYALFPLSTSGYAGTFQDIMHTFVVTLLVVLLSIASLVLIMIGGFKTKAYRSMAFFAAACLLSMFIGAIGVGAVPPAYFGLMERFSVFSALAFTAVLGCYIFIGIDRMEAKTPAVQKQALAEGI